MQLPLKLKVDKNTLKVFFTRRNLIRFVFYPLCGILVLTSLYHLYYAKKIIPGVFIGKIPIGGMTYNKARSTIQKVIDSTPENLTLKYQDYNYQIKGADILLEYNVDATVTRAFEVGRTGNVLTDTKDKLAGLVKPLLIKAFYDFDSDLLNTKFSNIKGELNKLVIDSSFSLNNKIEIVPSSPGLKVDDQKLYDGVINSFSNVDFSDKIIRVDEIIPKVSDSDLKAFQERVSQIVLNPIKITFQDRSWNLTPSQRLEFISIVKNDKNKAELILNKSKFETYLESLAQQINKLPRGQVTQTDGDKVVNFELTQSGIELNIKKFTEDFKKAFFDSKPSVEAAVIEINGPGSADKYGIFALLGEGKSKFAGSIPGRIHNLTLAASRASGILVPPNSIFSFNNTVGEISGRTGYDAAYIISNGRTILGEGGGVCQTSTTLFRAILNSGLPIVQRYPHAYRVHYYEEDSPVGFDASVFQPTLDLQFKNDTPNFVLIQSSWDLNAQTLNFKIYGTPDGRSVEISQPVVTNITSAPATLYQDDPTLPKGVVKQIDFSAGGATVSFTRVVKRGDQILYKDTFNSNYQPWRAIFLVGTKK